MHDDSTHSIPYKELWREVKRQFTLGKHSIHGPSHWRRVETIGLRLARSSGVDREVVQLFALFHDSRREYEHTDPEHGERGAALAADYRGTLFDIAEDRFEKLVHACRHHTDGLRSSDPTIATCWDADRLELARLGITPREEFLSTEAARERRLQAWAWKLAGDARRGRGGYRRRRR